MFSIYVIQNQISRSIYVGQTKNSKSRWKGHQWRANRNWRSPLYDAIRTYGIENFTFQTIEDFSSLEETNSAEQFWIEFFRSWDRSFGYNLTFGGDVCVVTPDVRKKMSESAKRRGSNSKGPRSKQACENIREGCKKRSDEWKKNVKIGLQKRGEEWRENVRKAAKERWERKRQLLLLEGKTT